MLSRIIGRLDRRMRTLSPYFRLRSTGERVSLIHVMFDEDQNLCLVEQSGRGRFVVREQELELEILHVGGTVAVCAGLALSGFILGWVMHL